MTEKKLTAVEWLIKQIIEQSNDVKLFDKALKMEREQHQRTYVHGLASWHSNVKFEDYYKNSFNNE